MLILQLGNDVELWDWLGTNIAQVKLDPPPEVAPPPAPPDLAPYGAAMLRRKKRNVDLDSNSLHAGSQTNNTSQLGTSAKAIQRLGTAEETGQEEKSIVKRRHKREVVDEDVLQNIKNDDMILLGAVRVKMTRHEQGRVAY